MWKLIARVARELNWSRRRWSAATDRAFHEELYQRDDYDPFSLAYPGYTTIRRFADLVEPSLPAHGVVIDLGCGPGEITSELAMRRRDLTFHGIDHSASAIAKANANVSRRSLTNVQFERADVEAYAPAGQIDLVTLFDAFHHLTNPSGFVNRLSPHVKRWALVEPRGSWAGTWQKDLELDWVAHDLDKIRAHIASIVHRPSSIVDRRSAIVDRPSAIVDRRSAIVDCPSAIVDRPSAIVDRPSAIVDRPSAIVDRPSAIVDRPSAIVHAPIDDGQSTIDDGRSTMDDGRSAVERRYTLDDFERFFQGLTLDLRGTVAGLESYPPGAPRPGELREQFGELRYRLYRDIDEWLFSRDLDLHAKHWLIVAERGGRTRQVARSQPLQTDTQSPSIAGPFDVRYGEYRGPREARPGEIVMGRVQLTNEGWDEWSSHADHGVFTSYHWLDGNGHIVSFDGERTPLPRTIIAGETCEVAITLRAPAKPGHYRLAIDLVREGITWFSQAGRPWLEVPFQITP